MDTVSANQNEVEELLRQASYLPDGDMKVMLLEEAVRLADGLEYRSEELQFKTRDLLVQAATFGGHPDKSLVAYSWCLAQLDNESFGVGWYFSRWEVSLEI